ncbi:hypothetical protein M0534_01615 [Methylonatrum kenyense]|uniref:hypothetical protein n=1 Tax=Methylonatrum kenyense TaxID=455253 RepID=UPI0020BDB67A|nr:hypothetical protein [Methylonatrum kenyense]MCK8515029.1 hypothetical protein [Methylonatrum kenyense]
MLITGVLLPIFLIHLVVFAILGLKRRQPYYLALVVTFSVLSAAMLVRLFWPEAQLANGMAVDQALRWAAWPVAAVSITWTVVRAVNRRRGHAGMEAD